MLYFDGCPNHEALLSHLREMLVRTGFSAEIHLRRIASDGAAQRERFLGSPTVRINGRDVEPEAERRNGRLPLLVGGRIRALTRASCGQGGA